MYINNFADKDRQNTIDVLLVCLFTIRSISILIQHRGDSSDKSPLVYTILPTIMSPPS